MSGSFLFLRGVPTQATLHNDDGVGYSINLSMDPHCLPGIGQDITPIIVVICNIHPAALHSPTSQKSNPQTK